MRLLTNRYGEISRPKLFGLVAVLGAVAIGSCELSNRIIYDEGVYTGTMQSFQREGMFWKTYEGQMRMQQNSEEVWKFSLDAGRYHNENIEQLAKHINDYANTGIKVDIRYIKPFFAWPWRGETDFFVQQIEPAE